MPITNIDAQSASWQALAQQEAALEKNGTALTAVQKQLDIELAKPKNSQNTGKIRDLENQMQELQQDRIEISGKVKTLLAKYEQSLNPPNPEKPETREQQMADFFGPAGTCFALKVMSAIFALVQSAMEQELSSSQRSVESLKTTWDTALSLKDFTIKSAEKDAEKLTKEAIQGLVQGIAGAVSAGISIVGAGLAAKAAGAQAEIANQSELNANNVPIPKAPVNAPMYNDQGLMVDSQGNIKAGITSYSQDAAVVDPNTVNLNDSQAKAAFIKQQEMAYNKDLLSNENAYQERITDSETLTKAKNYEVKQGIDRANAWAKVAEAVGGITASAIKFSEADLIKAKGAYDAEAQLLNTFMGVMQHQWDSNVNRAKENAEEMQKLIDTLKQLLQTFMQAQSAIFRG